MRETENTSVTAQVLPQQKLLLELIAVSGELSVPEQPPGSLLWKTLQECSTSRWINMREVHPGTHAVRITAAGREAGK